MFCNCGTLQPPKALLEVVGDFAALRNVSDYNDPNGILDRLTEWNIFKNGRVVLKYNFAKLTEPIEMGGNYGTAQIGSASDFLDFLAQKNINIAETDRLEVAIRVVNKNGNMSNLSNLILLPSVANDCCDDDEGFVLVVNGIEYCAVSPQGQCYVPQQQTI